NQYQKQINGINHLVIELKYAVFPESSGSKTSPALLFNTVIPDRRDPYSSSFFSRGGKRLFLYSEEKKVTINPRPTSYGTTEWLPTTAVSLSERWSRPLDELVAGEPITRTLYLSAQGLTSAQLPPLDIKAGDGFKIYPDQPQLNNDVSSNGVMGTRSESIAIVPSRGGSITLPPITVQWWDTASNQMRETVLDGQTLTIKPAENAISAPVSAAEIPSTAETPLTEKQQPSLIFWLLIIGNALLLGTTIIFLVLWRGARNKAFNEPKPSEESPERKEAALFKQLQQQARNKDPRAFRQGLLVWASVRWQHPLVTLDDVAVITKDPILTTELQALDQSLYSPDASATIDLGSLVAHLKDLRKQPMGEKVPKGNHLQALYAES
ncbi:MAG: BatD family protein, partial [Porticoccus sp.]|nr:BatD family protein [Porticoccus sp.]